MSSHQPRALITGASRGIGAAVARTLGSTHDLLLGGRDAHALSNLADTLPSASAWPLDLMDFDALTRAVQEIDRLDVLIHSAGVWEPGRVSETPPETWRQIFEVNVIAVAELTRLLLPALRVARGRIVLINSTAGKRASPARGAYAASKFALRAFGDALRAEEAEHGIGVTSVYPGRVATDMQRKVRQDENGPYREGDYLAPESVASAVLAAVTAPADSQLTEVVVTRSSPGS